MIAKMPDIQKEMMTVMAQKYLPQFKDDVNTAVEKISATKRQTVKRIYIKKVRRCQLKYIQRKCRTSEVFQLATAFCNTDLSASIHYRQSDQVPSALSRKRNPPSHKCSLP